MSQREKILAAVILCLVVALGGRYMYGRYNRSLQLRQTQLTAAQGELATVNMALKRGEWAVRQMDRWQARSLPPNREKALSLYKAWLLAQAKKAGLKVDNITPSPQVSRPTQNIRAIGYQMTGSGSLTSVVGLLYEFYRSPLLHQVTLLRLVRPLGATELQITFQAEALILPGANATDAVPEGDSKRLQLASLAEYQKSIGDRDLASVYTPPRPPVQTVKRTDPPAPPKFDDAELAHFTGAVSNGNGLEAWINVRTTGETLHLSAGDEVKVGSLEGQIVSIEPRSLVWQSGDKKFRVPLGESLRKGIELGADGKPVNTEQAERPES